MHGEYEAMREHSTYLVGFRDKGLGRYRQPATSRPESRKGTCRISKPDSETVPGMDTEAACQWRFESAAVCES
jgi:hypothetical protein